MTNKAGEIKTGDRVKFKNASKEDQHEFFVTKTRAGYVADDAGIPFIPVEEVELVHASNMKFFYVVNEDTGATLTLAYMPQTDRAVLFGFAICRPEDQFSKQAGRFYAIQSLERNKFVVPIEDILRITGLSDGIRPIAQKMLIVGDLTHVAVIQALVACVDFVCNRK